MSLFHIHGISQYPSHFLDNEHILIESGSILSCLNIVNGEQDHVLSLTEFDSISCIASNSLNCILVVAIDGDKGSRIEVYSFGNINDIELLHTLGGGSDMGYSHIDISNDGDYMISISCIPHLQIEFWSISKELKLASSNIQYDDIKSVSFSATSHDLFMTANNNTIVLWRVYYKFDQYFLTSTIHSLNSINYITSITFGERGNEVIYCNNLGEMIIFDEITAPNVIHKFESNNNIFKLLFTRFYYVVIFANNGIIQFIKKSNLQKTHQYIVGSHIKHCILTPNYQQLLIINEKYQLFNCFIGDLNSIKHHEICKLIDIAPHKSLNMVSLQQNDCILIQNEEVLLLNTNDNTSSIYNINHVSSIQVFHYEYGIDLIALGFNHGHIALCYSNKLNLKLFFAQRLFVDNISQIVFDTKGRLIACTSCHETKIWFIQIMINRMPKVLGYYELNKIAICCCWIDDEKIIISFECGLVATYNAPNTQSDSLLLESSFVQCELHFSLQKILRHPDGHRLLCLTQNNKVCAFLLDDDATIYPDDTFILNDHKKTISDIRIQNDLLLTSAHDGIIIIRNLSDPTDIIFKVYTDCICGILCTQFVYSGSKIVSIGYDGSVISWQLNTSINEWHNISIECPLGIEYLNELNEIIIDKESAIFEEKRKSERTNRFKQEFFAELCSIKSELAELQEKYKSIVEKVKGASPLSRLRSDELIVDTEQYEILLAENKEEIFNICESIKYENIGKELITRRIREQCWDKMAHKLQIVTAIKTNDKVSTFPILCHHKHDLQLMQKLEFIRKMNIMEQQWSIKTQDRVRDELDVTHSVSNKSIAYIWDINEEKKYHNDQHQDDEEDKHELKCAVSQELKHLLYHPMILYTNYRKRIQINLLNLRIAETKRAFNCSVESLFKLKKNEIERINEMSLEIRDIENELQLEIDGVFEYKLDDEEDKERIFRTTRIAKKIKRQETHIKNDDDTRRALHEMMNNTLESKDSVERLEDTLKKPDFMDKIEECSYNEEQRYQMTKYIEKKEALIKAKEVRRKLLRTQLKSLKNNVSDICKAFDHKVTALYHIGLTVMEDIYVHELMLIHLTNDIIQYEQHRIRMHNMDLELIRLKQDKEKADNTYHEFNDKLEESKKKLIQLLTADKHSEKTFKKEMNNDYYQYLYSIYKTTINDSLNQHHNKEEKEEELILNPYIKARDVVEPKERDLNKPTDLSESVWNRFLELKQEKMQRDVSISTVSDEIASMEAEVNALKSNQCIILESISDIERGQQILIAQRSKYKLDISLFLCGSQGNVEVEECPVVTDMRHSVMCHSNVIKHLNEIILNAGTQHIERLNEMKKFRRGINALNWKAKILDLEHRYYTLLTTEYQLRRVTKKEQEIIKIGGHSNKQKNDVSNLERKLQFTKNTMNHKIKEKKSFVSKYNMRIKHITKSNNDLMKEIKRLHHDFTSKQDIMNIGRTLSMKQEKKQITQNKMDAVVMRRKLVDLVKAQSKEIQFLRNELDRLRRSTFPSFSITL